ncbi:MAG: hypothetical protein ABI920_14360 [Casimicrobiaceae bacterium]
MRWRHGFEPAVALHGRNGAGAGHDGAVELVVAVRRVARAPVRHVATPLRDSA